MRLFLRLAVTSLALLLGVIPLSAQQDKALFQTLQQLDTELFSAANRCDIEKLGTMVADDLEFYHDRDGLMRGKQAFLNAVKNNTCHVMIRELVPDTFEVYPVKGYGAMELGVHRFHHPGHEKEFPAARQLGMTRFLDPGAAEWPVGEARFLMIWQLNDGSWKLTRVVSYAHDKVQ
ncbi:MAG TPA: nuclear transport factor 2 family protein [Edaphobacter sp.]|jgi:hypothetical protein|nr:nuclear transport factor 2 family protein [Edaphobacter sp.]